LRPVDGCGARSWGLLRAGVSDAVVPPPSPDQHARSAHGCGSVGQQVPPPTNPRSYERRRALDKINPPTGCAELSQGRKVTYAVAAESGLLPFGEITLRQGTF